MSEIPGYTYPPNLRAHPPVSDPRLIAQYDAILDQKLQERDTAHAAELSQREARWKEEQEAARIREALMQAQMQELANELRLMRGFSSSTSKPVLTEDIHMEGTANPQLEAGNPPTNNMDLPASQVPLPQSEHAGITNVVDESVAPVPATPPRRSSSTPVTPRNLRSASRKSTANLPSPSLAQLPKKATPGRKSAVKPATHTYRLLDSEVPKDAKTLKKAMSIHVRILAGWINAGDIPKDPPDQVLEGFDKICSDEETLETRRRGSPVFPPSLVQIGSSLSSTDNGLISKYARAVEENMLRHLQTCLAAFGLMRWCPDFRQSPYSLYNAACRIIAIDTFLQALIGRAYDGLQPNKKYASNMDMLVKLYNHIIHHYMYERYKKESRNPGSVQAADTSSPTYRARVRLADSRLQFLIDNGYPQRYQDMVDAKSTSDDEVDPEGRKEKARPIYWIKRRPERSAEAEIFFRRLNDVMELTAKQEGKKLKGRIRKIPPTSQKDSEFLALPHDRPLDYFAPDFFNRLQPRIRRQCAIRQIALLPNPNLLFTNCPDEFISDEAFMEKYGLPVLARYNLDNLDDANNEGDESFIDDDDDEMYED